MNLVIIGAGSNINPEENVSAARRILTDEQELLKASSFVMTAPLGFSEQPDFLNGAFLVRTSMGYREFVVYLKSIEDRLGRKRTQNRNGPRTIDLDVAVWNDEVRDPDVFTRPFLRDAVQQLTETVL